MDIEKSIISIIVLGLVILGVVYFRRFSYLLLTKYFDDPKKRRKQGLYFELSISALTLFEFPLSIILLNPFMVLENGPITKVPLWIFQTFILPLLLLSWLTLAICSYRKTKKEYKRYCIDSEGRSTWNWRGQEVAGSVLYAMLILMILTSILEHLWVVYDNSIGVGLLMSVYSLTLLYFGLRLNYSFGTKQKEKPYQQI